MNLLYNKDNFEWDCGVFQSMSSLENGKLLEAINDFGQCLQLKKEKSNVEQEGELISVVEIPDDLAERFTKTMNNLQNETVYNALFVMTVSYLEFSLVEICRLASIYLKSSFYTYRQGKGLDKVKEYLKEFLTIDISNKKSWSEFKVNANFRNCIAHNFGNMIMNYDIGLEQQQNYKTFKSNKNFTVTDTGFLFINTLDYIKQTHEKENAFINDVFNDVKAAMKKLGY